MITPEMAALIAKTQARALAGQPNAGGASPAVNPKSAAAAAAAAVAARLSSSFPSAAPRQMTTLPAPQQFAAAPSAVPRQMTTLPAPPQLVAAPQMLAAPHVVAAAVTGQISSAPTSSFKRRPDNWPPVGFARFGVLINGQQATPGMARHDMLVTVPVVSRLIGSQGSAYKEMTTSTGCNIHIIDKEAPPECPPWNTTGIMGGPHSSLRLVCLIGSPASVQKAATLILAVIDKVLGVDSTPKQAASASAAAPTGSVDVPPGYVLDTYLLPQEFARPAGRDVT